MKCYICLTDSIVNRKDYFNMLKVTLISARKNTSLRLICLYDGKIGDPVVTTQQIISSSESYLTQKPFK